MFNINKSIRSDYKPSEQKPTAISMKMIVPLFIGFLLTMRDFFLYLPKCMLKPKIENIANQIVLVTGGGNGLGRALSMRFAKEGCNVAIADIDINNAQKTAEEIAQKYKVQCKAFQCDISNYSAIQKLKNDVENSMGSLDILVNNAGLLYMSEFISSDVNDIERVVDVNLTAQIKMVKTFLPSMIERKKGRIVAIASATAIMPMPAATIYTSTKWGLRGFMKCLHTELLVNGQDFIKLSTVFPEFINTRKELSDTLDKLKFKLSRLSPERVAKETVNGMLLNKRSIIVSDMKFGFQLSRYLSDSGRKFILKASARMDSLFDSTYRK